MRRTGNFRRVLEAVLIGTIFGSVGCTHHHYYYTGTASAACPPTVSSTGVTNGAVCAIPETGGTVVSQSARPATVVSSGGRPPQVVVSEPKSGLMGRWRSRGSEVDSVATTTVEGGLEDESTSR